MGFDSVQSVRAGKFMQVKLNESSESAASDKVRDMCEKLLANTVIEDYEFEIIDIG